MPSENRTFKKYVDITKYYAEINSEIKSLRTLCEHELESYELLLGNTFKP